MMQDEMQKLKMAMMDMFGDVDDKFNRLMDIMVGNHDQVTPTPYIIVHNLKDTICRIRYISEKNR